MPRPTISGFCLLTLTAALLVTPTTTPAGAADPLRLEQYLDFEQVSDPQLSPDGARILYTRRFVDKIADDWKSALWIMNADGTKNRFLVDGTDPRWSPDGTRIAYLAEGEPTGSQIFVRWMDDEGSVTQITRVEKPPQSLQWSPDSQVLAFVALVPQTTPWKIELPKAPEGAKWTETPRIVERLTYRRDRRGFIEEGYQHVFVVPADGGTPRQLTAGEFNHNGNLSFTPDGHEILFTAQRTADWEYEWRESEIFAVNVKTQEIRQLTSRKGPDSNPLVSPDGKHVAYLGFDFSDDTYVDNDLYVMNIDGSQTRLLTGDFERSPSLVDWSADSAGIYLEVQDSGSSNLFFVRLAPAAPTRGRKQPPTATLPTIEQLTFGAHMLNVTSLTTGTAVGVVSSPHQPADVVRVALAGAGAGSIAQLTEVNEDILGGTQLGEVEEIWYDSVDGYRIQGWIVKPPDFDPQHQYPLMLSIHGGPHGMYNVSFNFGWQEHAAQGYVVLYTNPRGSTGYGSSFGNAIKWAYPSKDYDDLMAGVDLVVARGYIDTSRMFVYGCSGGGVLTSWVVGHTDRFAAASANCPVTNWLSFVGTTDGPGHWYRNFEKNFWEDPSEHLRRSPIMYVGHVKTPTMLMTGVNDLRTPMSQTEEYYQALVMRKVPTAMVRFNEEFHGTSSKPSNFLRTQLYLRYWFEKHAPAAREGEGPAPTAGSP